MGPYRKFLFLRSDVVVALVALAGLLTSVSTLGAQDVHHDLVASWRFNEGTGGSAGDASGNGHVGTIYGATWTTDAAPLAGANTAPRINPYALEFDGLDDFVQVSDSADFDVDNAFSLSAWVKADSAQPSPDGHWGIVDKSHAVTGANGWVLQGVPFLGFLPGMNRVTNPGEVIFAFGAGSGFIHIGTVDPIFDSTFHHLAVTWDGSQISVYLDAALKETVAFSGPVINNTGSLQIGKTACCGGRPFKGVIDEVRIYDIALNAGQVNALAHGGAVGRGR